jgi:hypothetical protein
VSAHETERLSAWLDGELSTADRAAVAAHLAGCVECARLLEAMAAVEERLRESAVEAPPGYFAAFPERIRDRLGEARPRRPRRVPSWTWAVAAALLLAVVTPLTLRTRATAPPSSSPPPRNEVAPGGAAEAVGDHGPGPAAARPVEPPVTRPPAPAARQKNEAAPPERGAAPASPSHDAAARPDRKPEQAAPAPAELRRQTPAAERDETAAGAAAFEAPARAAAVLSAPTAPAPLDEGRAKAVLAKRSVEDWRRERDRWRSFVEASPEAPGADAARLRVVEASFEILSLTGQEADREAFEREARAYLARKDAAGRDRVLGLLGRAEAIPR